MRWCHKSGPTDSLNDPGGAPGADQLGVDRGPIAASVVAQGTSDAVVSLSVAPFEGFAGATGLSVLVVPHDALSRFLLSTRENKAPAKLTITTCVGP